MIQQLLNIFSRDYRGSYFAVQLRGGFCNKLHHLFSACDIAINQGSYVIEPKFGWKEKKLFSDIYDLDYFNKSMSHFLSRDDLIVKKNDEHQVVQNRRNLWKHSEKILKQERTSGQIDLHSVKIRVLKSLKLKPELEA